MEGINDRTLKVKDIFGKLKSKKSGKSTEELMKEIDEELDSKFLKDNGKC